MFARPAPLHALRMKRMLFALPALNRTKPHALNKTELSLTALCAHRLYAMLPSHYLPTKGEFTIFELDAEHQCFSMYISTPSIISATPSHTRQSTNISMEAPMPSNT
jgi:hypothetical protein